MLLFLKNARSCMYWDEQKSRTVFATCRRALSCWKITPEMPWRKGTTLGYITSRAYLLLFRIPSIHSKLDRLWYEIVPHNFGCSATMSFDNARWKTLLTGIASNTNPDTKVWQIESGFIWNENLVPISLQSSVLMDPLQMQPSTFGREKDPVKRHSYTQSTIQQTSTNWRSRN